MSITRKQKLSLRGVTKRYGQITALSDVSIDIGQGEVVALLGENGAGKSTLVKIISGLVQPDSGQLILDGEEVSFHSSAAAQSHGIAVVTQEFSLVPTMSVAENLALGRVDSGAFWFRRKLKQKARELLSVVGLDDLDPSTIVEDLGVAERQLIEIARGLGREASLLILDEPTAALSDAAIDRVLKVVEDLAKGGRSIIYVTHRLSEVTRISDRIQVMRNGRNLPPVATASTDLDGIVEMMLGRELGDLFPSRLDQAEKTEVVLEVKNLSATGLSHPLSLTIGKGEIVGLTGQLGSGASETVRAIAGMAEVSGGEVILDGEAVSLRGRGPGLRRGLAYCSADRQRDGVFARATVKDNLSAAWLDRVASNGLVSERKETERASAAAAQFAIDPARFESLAGTLSGGNQQKVALGRWLGLEPTVLLADEPTRGVDVGARADIYRHLRDLADSGVAILLSSTDTTEIMGLCDRILTFYRGSVTGDARHTDWTEFDLSQSVMHSQEVHS